MKCKRKEIFKTIFSKENKRNDIFINKDKHERQFSKRQKRKATFKKPQTKGLGATGNFHIHTMSIINVLL